MSRKQAQELEDMPAKKYRALPEDPSVWSPEHDQQAIRRVHNALKTLPMQMPDRVVDYLLGIIQDRRPKWRGQAIPPAEVERMEARKLPEPPPTTSSWNDGRGRI